VFTAEQMLRSMDKEGVDRSLLIPFPVVDDFRAQHDEIGAAMRQWPDRFAGAACLYPFVDESQFRDEVTRCAETYGFRALKLQPMYQALNPVSRRSDFFFEAAQANGMAVVAHTGSGVPFSLPSLYIAAARRFPDLPIVLGHAGGPLLMLECAVAAEVCQNIFIEVSSLMPHHLAELLQYVPASRVMAGSDLPESVEAEIGKMFSVRMSDEDRRAMLWETGAALFGA
jgi:predicted TIM-barrel fold metal-dependent hydrolase